jgi:hypothetical protein
MAELILYGYIPKDSKEIPLGFIHKEAAKIRDHKSALSNSMRKFVLGMDLIDSIKKETDAKRKSENMGTEEIVMAGK